MDAVDLQYIEGHFHELSFYGQRSERTSQISPKPDGRTADPRDNRGFRRGQPDNRSRRLASATRAPRSRTRHSPTHHRNRFGRLRHSNGSCMHIREEFVPSSLGNAASFASCRGSRALSWTRCGYGLVRGYVDARLLSLPLYIRHLPRRSRCIRVFCRHFVRPFVPHSIEHSSALRR